MSRLTSTDKSHIEAGVRGRTLGTKLWNYLNSIMLPADGFRLFEDFHGVPGAALPTWLTTQDTSSAGTPTKDFVADIHGGAWAMKFDTTNEVETLTLYQGDQRTIDIAKKPIIEFRVKVEPDVTGAGGLFAAGDKLVIGLASDRNATLDSVATHAWFRMEGANLDILVETDDGTTDNDDNDTTINYVANTYLKLKIDCSNLADIRFYIDGTDRTPETMTLAAATGNLQVFIELQKAAAANFDHRVTVDWIDLTADR